MKKPLSSILIKPAGPSCNLHCEYCFYLKKKEIEIGYHILPEFWGKGYATEAALKVKDYAIEHKVADSLISVIDIRNEASQNVAKKLGMTSTKQIKCFDLDVYIYRTFIK